ncbi:MAG: hypothetical protein U1F34_01210 [Gammaproteobacteria bacterium]
MQEEIDQLIDAGKKVANFQPQPGKPIAPTHRGGNHLPVVGHVIVVDRLFLQEA